MKSAIFFSCTAIALALATSAHAADFYIDPINGSAANDGSKAKPWASLQGVIDAKLVESQNWESLPYAQGKKLVPRNPGAAIKAGDTIWLRNGYHGALAITGYYNQKAVTIAAMPGESAKFSTVLLRSSSNWIVSGLQVSPEFAPTYKAAQMISVETDNYSGPTSEIVVEKCLMRSKLDVSKWTMSDWDTLSANGISAGGDHITIRDNQLINVNFGISVTASNALVERNSIDSFSGDGMRGLGNYSVFQYNTVKSGYQVNANHMDAFQSWSVGSDGKVGTGEVIGIVLRGNRFINYVDPNQPFRGNMQGVGCFDGTYTDWVVENNVIMTDTWHGISFYGAKNVRVINNTVVDLNAVSPGPPWIMITAHKNGAAPVGCLVRNNLTTALNIDKTGTSEDHNIIVKDMAALFINPANWDLHLNAGAAAIDVGSPDSAPGVDFDGISRPQGKTFDVGAYEWHVPGIDAGPGDSGSGGSAGSGGFAGSGGSSPTDSGSAGAFSDAYSDVLADSGNKPDGTTDASDSNAGDSSGDSGCGCRVGANRNLSGFAVFFFALFVGRARFGTSRKSKIEKAEEKS